MIYLDEYKDYAGISSIDNDLKLQGIITRVSQLVKSYCSREFELKEHVEYTRYPGRYFTKEFPLVEVLEVTGGTGFVWDRELDCVEILGTEEATNQYMIRYKAGYPQTPEDLKLALLDLVDFYYRGESVPRKASGNVVMEFVVDSSMPPHIKRVLDLYRNLK